VNAVAATVAATAGRVGWVGEGGFRDAVSMTAA